MALPGGQPSERPRERDDQRIGLVLPGGGARGAYEAGALSVLLPALEERGEKVSIYCGTSVGAINGVALASHAHLGPTRQAKALLETWRSIDKHEVTGRLLGPDLAVGIGSYLGEALGLPGVRYRGLIQARPLRENIENWIDWPSLHDNVSSGIVDSVCAVATSLKTGAPVGFTERHGKRPLHDGAEEIHYEPVELDGNHIRASAAIPAIFPPIEVPGDGPASGWFVDGATRLNTPIRPAIDLGAERVIVISFEPYALSTQARIGSRRPGFADIAANVLDGLLTDQVVADIQRLVAINSFFAESTETTSKRARAYRESRRRRHYRKIGYALVAPRTRRRLGRLAERIFERRFGGLGALRDIDLALMARVLGGGPSRGELLTFLFFDPAFIEALIDAGRRDARYWLSRHPHLWCSDASHDFDLDPGPPVRLEESAIEEFRSLRGRG